MELTIRVNLSEPVMSRQAADISSRMSEYKSRVLLRRRDTTVNAKSLMGLMSLGLSSGQAVTIIASGEDEAEAANALSVLLGTSGA